MPDRDNKSLLIILLTHMHNAFRYRLYPTRKQETVLDQQLEECRWLYKHFLEYRKNAREWYGISSYSGQKNTLPALKKERSFLDTGYPRFERIGTITFP
ncbi:MAG: helix-turn-helix domain-containing protein [Nitrospiraceae bacterium]|nr:helix-turn-helix domain-containing protein [Nitrospiraceae bacterium]